ncbi:hypothetical protein JYQ62_22870 [Nostoc sp. UHCC 0702]|nr:hypothetical protein JYQ62_22870 [Nostoc sp. UHCC 0702]
MPLPTHQGKFQLESNSHYYCDSFGFSRRLSAIAAAADDFLTKPVPLEPWQRGGTVVINFNNNQKAYERFQQEKISIDVRPGFGLRFSPHIYNDEEEIEKVIALIQRGD